MTELHPKAKQLIQRVKSNRDGGRSDQEPSNDELREVLEGFHRRARERTASGVSQLGGSTRTRLLGDTPIPKNQLNRSLTPNRGWSPSRWFEDFAYNYRRGLLKWSLLAAIMTGSLGAFANWGPAGWREDLGQLAETVTESLDELVIQVTGRSKQPKGNGRAEPVAEVAARTNTVDSPSLLLGPGANDAPANDALAANSESAPVAMLDPGSRTVHPRPRESMAPDYRGSTGHNADPKRSIAPHATVIGANQVATAADARSTVSTPRGPSAFSEAEVNLIAAARSALAGNNYAQTRRLLDEHGASFPRGALSEERETLRALVACRESGNTSLARAYVNRRPQSLFAPRLVRECGLVTDSPPASTIP